MNYKIIERTPTISEYNDTRRAAGLAVKNERAAQVGLSNTLYAVCVVTKILW
ncbi:MAG TPA: hypothetical protein VK208_22585 [Pyrinomonadaceae bacterium]|jgi:hypothetical protein|nr:hypothetical protein [Pyrinomonadaceae bacterium]